MGHTIINGIAKKLLLLLLVTLASILFRPALAGASERVLGQTPLSPAALAATADGTILYVGCATASRVLAYDTVTQQVVQEFAVPASPSGLVLSPDESRLYITCAGAASTICGVDTASGAVVIRIAGGHTTMAPVLSPCGGILYVCHRFEDRVCAIELATGRELWTLGVEREPIAAALSSDGRTLVVANHLNKGRADDGLIGAKVSLVDVETGAVSRVIQLPRGSGLARGVAISPDGKFAAVTHLLARYYLPTSDVAFGGINGNVVSLIDLEQGKWIRNVYLDTSGRGAANPWAVLWTPDGKSIVVTHAGAHELSVLDAPVLPQKPVRVRARIALPGNGPRALAAAGSRIFVANYFSDNIAQVDLAHPGAEVEVFELAPPQEWTQTRRGEALFNDGTLCYQAWQSCASCHDSDGRADGLNWDLLNDGSGNPKNAKTLVWAHQTPPAMALGVRAGARVAVRAGLKHILFQEQPEPVAEAIDAYLQQLSPAASPALVEGQLSVAAKRGELLFADPEVGCARCHPAPTYTDLRTHHVGTSGRHDRTEDRFDTPALVELWRTAPFLHDGSAATLRDVLTTRNLQDQHGRTSQLSLQAIDDLAEYLRSL